MSTISTIITFVRLLPSIFALRHDRRQWANQDAKEIDYQRYRKNARKLTKTFIALGPVYIKLGQWLSSRADILPQPYMEELAQLQDDVPAAPFDQIRPIIEKDLGPITDRFTSINQDAISGASLGQVYRASIDGQEVVVKVRRPGIEKIVKEDLKILKKILPIALRFVDPNLQLSVKAMLTQFIETIYEEMDYVIESENLKRIKKNIQKEKNVLIPNIIEDYSTKNILTMEYIPGIKITNIDALDKKGVDRQKLVVDVHKVFFTMLLRDTIFHADPHPGNISVSDNGEIILYDYGMVGHINDETRRNLVRLYLALVEKDPTRTVNAMNKLGMLAPDFNQSVIEKAIELTVKAMHGKKPDEMEVKSLMELANKTMSKFPFVLPKHLALYMRMASIIEGIYKTHRVNFKFINVLKKILEDERLIYDAYIEEIKCSFERFSKSIDATISIAPELKRLLDNNNSLQLQPKSYQNVLFAGSILASAVFVGSAVMYTVNESAGIIGMAASVIIMGISTLLRKK